MPERTITLASRDSLLALAQTITAALRLEQAGFTVKILTMKTAGDLSLNAPLYEVAQKSYPKEGRAFFTKELDEALLSDRADAAVHSFKDLPTESVDGISAPLFFGEVTGNDALLLRQGAILSAGGEHLVIGTSSLRRIHQVQLLLPQAVTVTLRGNVITRLHKLLSGDRGMNAILIAEAGIQRLVDFAMLPEERYVHFVTPEVLAHIRSELLRFHAAYAALERRIALPEQYFPTAPGQGVLALQLSARAAAKLGSSIAGIFAEHEAITARVAYERRIMAELMTGCHAPLGVSAFVDSKTGEKKIFACFSRKVTTEPLVFADSVWYERILQNNLAMFVHELRAGSKHLIWWGFKKPPQDDALMIDFVAAIRQVAVPVGSYQIPEAVFAASPQAADWIATEPALAALPLYAAGKETALHLAHCIAGARIIQTIGKGFSSVLSSLPSKGMHLLWVGSVEGEERARRQAQDFPHVHFLPVYKNEPVVPQHLSYPEKTLHVLTSRVAAEAFAMWVEKVRLENPVICCFGDSAAEVVRQRGWLLYYVSNASCFAEFIRELKGDPLLLRERWHVEEQTHETKTI